MKPQKLISRINVFSTTFFSHQKRQHYLDSECLPRNFQQKKELYSYIALLCIYYYRDTSIREKRLLSIFRHLLRSFQKLVKILFNWMDKRFHVSFEAQYVATDTKNPSFLQFLFSSRREATCINDGSWKKDI